MAALAAMPAIATLTADAPAAIPAALPPELPAAAVPVLLFDTAAAALECGSAATVPDCPPGPTFAVPAPVSSTAASGKWPHSMSAAARAAGVIHAWNVALMLRSSND